MIGILDLDLGNLKSVGNAVYELGYDYQIINNKAQLDDITHLIIPGVGAYPVAMKNFHSLNMKEALDNYIASGRPLLGICLGMQILSEYGHEIQHTQGLGLISGEVRKFSLPETFRIPHVGWNSISFRVQHPVFENIKNDVDFYFVHSFHIECENESNIYATTNYGYEFTSVIGYKNILGTQFHPEKSQNNGLKILENFCNWDGK